MSSVVTPLSSTFSTVMEARSPATAPPSPETSKPLTTKVYSPNQYLYYLDYLNKSDFNLILINSSVKLLQAIFDKDINQQKVRFFIVEILRRLKTSIQLLQLASYYLARLTSKADDLQSYCPRKLFLTLIILALKFNQDYNYLFKLWLKICGSNNDDELSIKELREIEINVLKHLNYELYLNATTYENWCNLLMVFSYDFISTQKISPGASTKSSEFQFDNSIDSNTCKFQNWFKIFANMNLKVSSIQFRTYFNSNIGSKITFVDPVVPLLFKRSIHALESESAIKKCKLISTQT